MTLDPRQIGFGGAGLGNLFASITNELAQSTLEAAWHLGIRYYDTAPFYGFGLSERRIGNMLRGRRGYRLSTKVGRLLVPDGGADVSANRQGYVSPMPFRPVYDYSYDGVMRSYEASLQRLGLAKIDILYVHDIGQDTHGDDHARHWRDLFDGGGYRALETLRSAGDVGAIGMGVNETAVCLSAMECGQFDLFLLAGRYTLIEQAPLDDLLPACAASGTKLVVGGPYNSGILVTGTRSNAVPMYNYAAAPPDVVTKVRKIEEVSDRFAVPLAAAALQFPVAHPQVDNVCPGMASPLQVSQTMAFAAVAIPKEFWAALRDERLIRADAPTPLSC